MGNRQEAIYVYIYIYIYLYQHKYVYVYIYICIHKHYILNTRYLRGESASITCESDLCVSMAPLLQKTTAVGRTPLIFDVLYMIFGVLAILVHIILYLLGYLIVNHDPSSRPQTAGY